ncbi:MAG: hypothetical protein HRU28_14740 [Rhizobiales bacterium]|nr:hypothetical protein [Hyphomicrobiales bacterium]
MTETIIIKFNYAVFFGSWIIFSIFLTWLSYKIIDSQQNSDDFIKKNRLVLVMLNNGDSVGKNLETDKAIELSKNIISRIQDIKNII